MARIDAGFGRQAGVNPVSITPERSTAIEDLARGVEAVGAVVEERKRFSNEVEFIRERRADDLALSDLASRRTLDWNKRLDELADGYDGSQGGFADAARAEFEKLLDEDIAREPSRRQREARLALMPVAQRLSLAAYDVEDRRRDAFILGEAARQNDSDANAVRRDPAFYETALENHERRRAALPASLQADFDKSRKGLALAYGEARIDADPDGFIRELNDGGLADLDSKIFSTLLGAATRESEQRARQRLADQKQASAEARAIVGEELKSINAAIEAGLPVDPARLSDVAGVAVMGGAETQALVAEQAALIRGVSYIQRAPFADAAAELAAERARLTEKGDASPSETRRLTTLEKAFNATRARASADFAAFAMTARPDMVAPLDPDALDGAAIKKRGAQIDAAAAYYGVADDNKAYLSDTERAAFARRFQDDPQNGLAAAAVLAAAGPSGGAMLAEIAPKAPELAHLGGLLAQGGDQQFIDDAARGAELARRQGFRSAAPKLAHDEARAQLGPAFALFPQSGEAAASAARLAYEARAARAGLAAADFDPTLFARAIEEAAGATYDARGRRRGGTQDYTANRYQGRVLLPSWMREGDIKRHMRALAEEDLPARAIDDFGNGISIRVLRNAFPVAVGDGLYQLALGDPAQDPEWVKDETTGEELVIDLGRVRDRLAPRPASGIAETQRLQGVDQ